MWLIPLFWKWWVVPKRLLICAQIVDHFFLYLAGNLWVVHFCILIVVIFSTVPMSTIAQNGSNNRQLVWTTGFVEAVFFRIFFMILIKIQLVSVLFFYPFFYFYINMRDSTRTFNRCLIVRRQKEFGSGGLCARTGLTQPIVANWITDGGIFLIYLHQKCFIYALGEKTFF